MKKIVFITISLIIFASAGLKAQIVDTICASDPFGAYTVQGYSGSTYYWNVTGGIIFNTNGADSVEVHWDPTASVHHISVIEISKNGCIGDTVKGSIVIVNPPDIEVFGPDSVCRNEKITLHSSPAVTYDWSTGDKTSSTSIKVIGDTTVTLVADNGCYIDTVDFKIKALPLPLAAFSVFPTTIVPGKTASFISNSNVSLFHTWIAAGDTLTDHSTIVDYIFDYEGYYTVVLMVENKFTCRDTARRQVIVREDLVNTITPDGDGINDTWELDHLKNYPDCKVRIFDRWSGQIFYSEGYKESWDGTYKGTPVPEGSYYYIIEYGDGSDPAKGVITVIR
ncbi:MAG: gliding motility-associated C-terminal domain-containing protein [Bacteroidales bacterium]|nr:gliding motility-associated C-terminal domain-containing protein [Bacteroidales bacterium]